MKLIKFKQWVGVIEINKYHTGNICLNLVEPPEIVSDGSPIARITTNLPGLNQSEIAIKDWSENEGMYKTLIEYGVITPAHRFLSSGYIESIPVCYLKEI